MGYKTRVTKLLTRPTWGVKWSSFGYVVFHKDGCALINKCFHTFWVSLKGSQIQSSAALLIPDVQVHQGLQQDFHGLMMPIVGLQKKKPMTQMLAHPKPHGHLHERLSLHGHRRRRLQRAHQKDAWDNYRNAGNQRVRLKIITQKTDSYAWIPLCSFSFFK